MPTAASHPQRPLRPGHIPGLGGPFARQAADAFAKLGARIEEARTHFVIALCDGVVGTPREIEALSTGLQLPNVAEPPDSRPSPVRSSARSGPDRSSGRSAGSER